jgi:phosphopantothenoylcysteine decarboxylase/phosphopantothenate--cysteine ligase
MEEPSGILAAITALLAPDAALSGRRALVTSGPTHEPIDPVRFLANRSSGKQGHAIAEALAARGADTVLVTGPTGLPDPAGVTVRRVETALDMLAACKAALPVDVAVLAAAVGDWRIDGARQQKLKRSTDGPPTLDLVENPDILATIAAADERPELVVGFAAETDNVVDNAVAKRRVKGCDWIIANDVAPGSGTFGGDHNTVHVVTEDGVEAWPTLTKNEVARRLADRIASHLVDHSTREST